MDGQFAQPRMQNKDIEAGLYIVSTPIGNLGDITLRALETLKACAVVLCEDTRVTGKLMSAYNIATKLAVYNDHSDDTVRCMVLERLAGGEAVALVSDAGTPLVSDPGYKLVHACQKAGHKIVPVPGANALLPALQLAGLPSDSFYFGGFLPRGSGARQALFAKLKGLQSSLVFYESPNRLHETVTDAYAALGDRPVALVREITKMFETTVRGTLKAWVQDVGLLGVMKGECVLVIGGQLGDEVSEDEMLDMLRNALKGQSVRDAAAFVSEATGFSKKKVYDFALSIKDER